MPGGLEQALRGLSVRVVYFDAHNDALFMVAAWAIDIIQGLDARAILLTPGRLEGGKLTCREPLRCLLS